MWFTPPLWSDYAPKFRMSRARFRGTERARKSKRSSKNIDNTTMKKTLHAIGYGLMVFALFDMLILFAGLGQIAMEGRTGYWAPFWRVQAEFVVGLLQ